MKSEFRLIPIGELVPSPSNNRKTYDLEAMGELLASIKEKGILNPLLVRPIGTNGSSSFEILAGSRRFRAAKIAKLKEVPAIVRELDDKAALEVIIIDNLQREDVHPMEEAAGYEALIAHGYDVAGLAVKIGKSASYVYQRLKLTELTEDARRKFLENKITAGHAVQIARLQPKDQAEALRYTLPSWADAAPRSIRDLSRFIAESLYLDLHAAAFPKDEESLIPEAGSCKQCPKRSGFNRELFSDIQKSDICTDRTCFHKKQAAFLDRRRKELGEGTILLSTSGYLSTKDEKEAGGGQPVVTLFEYKQAGGRNGKCPSAVVGLLVDGPKKGQALKVCIDKSCKVHRPAAAPQRSAPSRAERLKREITEEVFIRSLRAVIGKVNKPTPDLFRALVHRAVSESYVEDLTPVYPGIADLYENILKRKKVSEKELSIAAVLTTFGSDSIFGLTPDATQFVESLRINPKAIEKQVRAESKKPCPVCGKKPLSPGCSWPNCEKKKGEGEK